MGAADQTLETSFKIASNNSAIISYEKKMRRKRCMDITLAALLISLIAPLLLAITVVIKLVDHGPILFVHHRIGLAGRTFGCLKFRTMRPDADQVLTQLLQRNPIALEEWTRTRKLKCDPRVTRIGRLLRVTSLDELPQLFNVLRGDMSLVGPRPVVREELLHKYKGGAAKVYMSVRPGLTGLWQVSGRSDIDYTQRVALDSEYAKDLSLSTDIRLLCRTVGVLLRPRGSY